MTAHSPHIWRRDWLVIEALNYSSRKTLRRGRTKIFDAAIHSLSLVVQSADSNLTLAPAASLGVNGLCSFSSREHHHHHLHYLRLLAPLSALHLPFPFQPSPLSLNSTFHLSTIAVTMAAFMSQNPHQLPTALSHQTLPSNTPPEQRSFAPTNNPLQRTPSQHLVNGSRAQQRMSGEFRNRGPIGVNGNGAVPVPTAAQSQLPNGQQRNMPGMAGSGAFDMPRSPPNSKSMSTNLPKRSFLYPTHIRNHRYFSRAMQILSTRSLPGW